MIAGGKCGDGDGGESSGDRRVWAGSGLPDTLKSLLGGWPDPAPAGDGAILQSTVQRGEIIVESLQLPATRRMTRVPGPSAIPALLCYPTRAPAGPLPVVLYIHAHGGDYALGKEELLAGRQALPCGPYAPVLSAAGYAVLCIDLPCFGARSHTGETALAKRLLWQGDTLLGLMLRDLASAIDYLQTRTDIDSERLATLGISMGSTLGWWLAALDQRVMAVAELCCLSDIASLIELDAHDQHALYLCVPGLLKHASILDINRLLQPRPRLCAIGGRDTLTPAAATQPLVQQLMADYRDAGLAERFTYVFSAETGHEETEAMRRSVMSFLQRHLLEGTQER